MSEINPKDLEAGCEHIHKWFRKNKRVILERLKKQPASDVVEAKREFLDRIATLVKELDAQPPDTLENLIEFTKLVEVPRSLIESLSAGDVAELAEEWAKEQRREVKREAYRQRIRHQIAPDGNGPPDEIAEKLTPQGRRLFAYLWTHPISKRFRVIAAGWPTTNVQPDAVAKALQRLNDSLTALSNGTLSVENRGEYVKLVRSKEPDK